MLDIKHSTSLNHFLSSHPPPKKKKTSKFTHHLQYSLRHHFVKLNLFKPLFVLQKFDYLALSENKVAPHPIDWNLIVDIKRDIDS